jgi:hypothetical protein
MHESILIRIINLENISEYKKTILTFLREICRKFKKKAELYIFMDFFPENKMFQAKYNSSLPNRLYS